MREIRLSEMLDARERRAATQRELLARFGCPLICFTLNIPGPVKDSPLIRRAANWGRKRLLSSLQSALLSPEEIVEKNEATGYEGYFPVRADPLKLKALTASIEDENALGRLFDLDVLDSGGTKLDRALVGGGPRGCIVCGAPGRSCASRRSHTVSELQAAVRRILTEHFAAADRTQASSAALRAVLDEVCTTPKPGLVDRVNSGSHKDMDIFTFTASAAALVPYWESCVKLGQESRESPPEETFRRLRRAGLQAERDMLRATGGVNTHKGAIFSLGTLCGAVGRLWRPEGPCRNVRALLNECAAMTVEAVRSDFAAISASERRDTVGARLYLDYGLEGIRGEVARGFPSVKEIGLPAFEAARKAGLSRNDAGAAALIHLIAKVNDTNMISRGGMEAAEAAKARAAALLRNTPLPSMEAVAALDASFIADNLSPGGCADLLAVTLFLSDWSLKQPD